jgi:cell division protein FtsB
MPPKKKVVRKVVRKKKAAPPPKGSVFRKRTPFSLSKALLFLATFLFVFFVIWSILPEGTPKESAESLSELKARLDRQRADRQAELEEELAEIQMENEKLRREIERLKAGG